MISINKSNQSLTQVPRDVLTSYAQQLDLSNNQITEIPRRIDTLWSLQILNLSNNNLTILPKEIGNLINLHTLDLSSNNLTCIPDEICDLTNLQTIYLFSNNLTNIPWKVNNLISLKDMYISDNMLQELPREIGELKSLQILDISFNKLVTLPKEMINLKNLHTLNLIYNNLIKLPSFIGDLKLTSLECNCILPPNIINMFNKNFNNMYVESLSVHGHSIQDCTKESIFYILDFQPADKNIMINEIINDNILTNATKELLFEFCKKNLVHSILNITFEDLLQHVWPLILSHWNSFNIKHTLNERMKDPMCLCLTCGINNLVSCLCGFYDNIKVELENWDLI